MYKLFTSILTPQQIDKDHMRFSQRLPNIITQLPWDAFGIDAFSILPRYATTLSEQLTQTRKNPNPLGDIYQVKYIANKYGRIEYLPLLKYQACSKSTTTKISYILKKKLQHTSLLDKHHLPSQQILTLRRLVQEPILL